MEEYLKGQVLLVGEGDFSFTVALLDRLGGRRSRLNITATSLESEETIIKHKNATENMENLQSLGVYVKLNTDATQLHTNPALQNLKFDNIIFNFPHAGGKSNHKKNRKLLNDFFASAVNVLSAQGQIFMTLCKGQGGTPADQPMRAWHDSWQVVSMAANSGLILTAVRPFDTEQYTVYSSTGFRSLDKGFHTEHALTHVFELARRVEIPDCMDSCHVQVGGAVYACPPYIHKKLASVSYINQSQHHPVHWLYRLLKHALMESLKTPGQIKDVGLCHPLIPVAMETNKQYSNLTSMTLYGNERPQCSTVTNCNAGVEEEFGEKSNHVCNLASCNLEGCYFLVRDFATQDTDLDDTCLEELMAPNTCPEPCDKILLANNVVQYSAPSDNGVVSGYGPVFRRCTISEDHSPVSYCMTTSWPLDKAVTFNEQCLGFFEKPFSTCLTGLIRLTNDFDENAAVFCVKSKLTTEGGVEQFLYCDNETLVGNITMEVVGEDKLGGDSGSRAMNTIGDIYIIGNTRGVINSDSDLQTSSKGVKHVVLSVDLSELICLLCNIEDRRLLWSTDARVVHKLDSLSHFLCKAVQSNYPDSVLCQTAQDCVNFQTTDYQSICTERCKLQDFMKPVSLYPMKFVHDMSFWENETEVFDELTYCDVIRNMAGDTVISVELLDTYVDSVTGRKSRCYRLTFQSADSALSYDTSWKLQSLIRLEVQKQLHITLR